MAPPPQRDTVLPDGVPAGSVPQAGAGSSFHRPLAESARRGSGATRRSRLGALPATLSVMALASGAVGLLSSPAEGGAVDASRVGMRLPGPAHSDTVAQAVAESRQQRVSRSMQRYAQLRSEAQAAIALDKRIDAMEQEMAAEQAAAEKRAAAAREAARPKWVLPVLHFHLTAGFGESSGLWAHRHTGQDFAAPTGTPIRAVGDGRIVFAGWDGPYGRKIIVRHSDGTETWYCHMSAFLRTGGTVKAGQVIGRVGSTGNTTGPHLHLEVRPGGGAPINPLPWLRAHGVKV